VLVVPVTLKLEIYGFLSKKLNEVELIVDGDDGEKHNSFITL
jgi:hypothetical protein